MSTVRKTYKNMLWLAFSELISKASFLVITIWAARLLTKEGFGVFSLALSISMMAIVFCDFGISTLTVREVSRKQKDIGNFMRNPIVIKLGLSCIIGIVYLIFGYFNGNKDMSIFFVLYIFAVFTVLNDQVYSFFRGIENMFIEGIIKTFRAFLILVLGFASLKFYNNALIFGLSLVIAEFLTLLIAGIIIRPQIKNISKKKSPISGLAKTLKEAIPFGFAFVFASLYLYFGTIMLANFGTSSDVASFSVAYQLVLALLFIPMVYTNSIFPMMSRFYLNSKDKLIFLYERSFKYLLIIGIAISACLLVFSNRLIAFIYGSRYPESGVVLFILSIFIFFKYLNFSTGYILSSSDFQSKRMISQATAAAASIFLSFILIKGYGYKGAAYAIIATEIILFMMYFYYVSTKIHKISFTMNFIKAALASLSFVIIGKINLEMIIALPLAFVSYAALVLIFKLFDKEDFRIFKEAIFKKI